MSTKRKLDVKVAKPALKQSAKLLGKQRLNDSRAVIVGGGSTVKDSQHDVVEISSGEEEEESSDDDVDAEGDIVQRQTDDVSMADVEGDEEISDDLAQPSFGDLVRINAAEPIDVAAAFDSNANERSNGNQNIQAQSGASLGTVLTQALKTNDQSLLESCLQETNLQTVRLTLQRLASPLASNLLHHLAARLHRRPGRAGSLIVWIQWTLVTHGGYLATQTGLNKELAELHRVVEERSRGLQPLLVLKGKLDMLEAQLKLRKSMQNHHRSLDDEDDEEAVIYVEGEESDDEENDQELSNGNSGAATNGIAGMSDVSSEISEDMPNTNGIIADSEDQDSGSEDEDLIDDEAEETDAESGDEDEVDFDDQDEVEEEEDSEEEKDAGPPNKMQKVSNTLPRRR